MPEPETLTSPAAALDTRLPARFLEHKLSDELRLAVELASRAGSVALKAFRQESYSVSEKAGDLGPVTTADKEANALIVRGLEARFGDDLVIAEESANTRPARLPERLWFVDPIDGTREFIAGRTSFAVMIGLVVGENPALGVVLRPATGECFIGLVGVGALALADISATDSAAELRVSAWAETRGARLMRSRSHQSARVTAVCERLELFGRRLGSMGLKMAEVAAGRAEAYVNLGGKASLWDVAGPAAIVTSAGGLVTDREGCEIDYRALDLTCQLGVCSTNGLIHESMVQAIADELQRGPG